MSELVLGGNLIAVQDQAGWRIQDTESGASVPWDQPCAPRLIEHTVLPEDFRDEGSLTRRDAALSLIVERLFSSESRHCGMGLETLSEAANEILTPHINGSSEAIPVSRMILGSGTDNIDAFRAEVSTLQKTGRTIGINRAIESRDAHWAKPGDIVPIFNNDTEDVLKSRDDIQKVDLRPGSQEAGYYYNSHQLLHYALYEPEKLEPLVEWLREPDGEARKVVKVYLLDREMQLVLLHLAERAGLDHLHIEANSSEIERHWNNKEWLYPKASDVVDIGSEKDYEDVLSAEGRESRIYRELGVEMPRMPGYLIERDDSDYEQFRQEVRISIELFDSRYGIKNIASKRVRSSDGANIGFHAIGKYIKNGVVDEEQLDELAIKLWEEGQSLVLEPMVSYRTKKVGGRRGISIPIFEQ